MFYYISFLRPPPSQVPPGAAVVLTPQIANDLRTELYDVECDIFYAWTLENTSINHPPNSSQPKPVKLTKWMPSNLYKELKIPPPPRAREGQRWRLHLTCSENDGSSTENVMQSTSIISLSLDSLGRRPFPVLSMPILFTSQSGGKTTSKAGGSKQERIERLYSFTIELRIGSESNVDADAHELTPSTVVLRVLEQTSFDLDKKVWDSGIGLSSWIVGFLRTNEPLNPQSSRLYDTLFSAKTKRIVELGTGTGMVSLVLSAARAALLSEETNVADIVATDLPSALPLLEHNIELNRSSCFARRPPLSMALDWDEYLAQDISDAGRLDLIVMADVTYNTASFPSLIKTLLNLLKLGLDHDDSATPNTSDLELAATPPRPPLILLGYKQRDEGERSLWEMAKENGVSFELIGKREGAGGEPVEIWVGEYGA